MARFVIGLDYGTDSARALVVNAETGEILSSSVKNYPRWSRGLYCDPASNQWRQHPKDYLEVLEFTVRDALSKCDPDVAANVVGLAFDTTGSTPAFADETGAPLALSPEYSNDPDAMFILWKDHTAIQEAAEINEACKASGTDYSMFEGGVYSPEWFWAKALHILRNSPEIATKASTIVECCEWLPAVLTGVTDHRKIVRSRCAQGHKSMWSAEWGGLPPEDFLSGIDPALAGWRSRLFENTETADKPVGHLCPEWAGKLGLSEKVIVAGGAFDCHMGAVGAGVKPYTLVRVIGTSTCDVMVVSHEEIGDKCIKGICGQVDGSVIPGMIGLEAGQSSFGDVYAMFRRVLEWPLRELSGLEGEALEEACGNIIPSLTVEAERIPVSESGMLSTDWVNGRRTPDANPLVKGTVSGFTLGTTAPMIFRSLVEATAFGTKAIHDRFAEEGVRIDEVIGIGGIALKSPFVMQTMCDVLGKPIKVCKTMQACALGAAMFAATAAGVYEKVEDASLAMSSGFSKEYVPDPARTKVYSEIYKKYLALGSFAEEALY
ncbi:MAG: ribulokinase [Bacteroidales bacterium]|nr:ribulokinase [Bacteroidales bacterium]